MTDLYGKTGGTCKLKIFITDYKKIRDLLLIYPFIILLNFKYFYTVHNVQNYEKKETKFSFYSVYDINAPYLLKWLLFKHFVHKNVVILKSLNYYYRTRYELSSKKYVNVHQTVYFYVCILTVIPNWNPVSKTFTRIGRL